MDFVKSLLLYMTLTVASGLQAAPTPGEAPKATPAISVESVESVQPTDESGAPIVGSYAMTPGPATPTPLPTITPNTAYTTLSLNSKGDDVRKLQTRLVELGYLQGNIDGAYGYQTRNAVMLFQEVNHLQKDGAAGRETQTRLFEDPDVIPNPAVITPSPVPTATPDDAGMIPLPEEPTENWVVVEKAQVLMNGYRQVVPATGKAPRVWKRGDAIIVSLSDLFSALEMDVTASWDNEVSFAYAGYQVSAQLASTVIEGRSEDDTAYAQVYDIVVDEGKVEVDQGDLMYEDGQWYATTAFLTKTLHAQSRWDEEEKTLMLTVQDKALYNAVD